MARGDFLSGLENDPAKSPTHHAGLLKISIPRPVSAPSLRRSASAASLRGTPGSKRGVPLCPSTGPTPRFASRAVISAPSNSVANDPARARNLGQRLYASNALEVRGVARVASEPTLVSGTGREEVTPRRMRGMVRTVSKVPICRELATSAKTWRPSSCPGPTRTKSESSLHNVPKPGSRPSSAPAKQKRVSFADEFPDAKRKSAKLLDSLYALRRARSSVAPAPVSVGDVGDAAEAGEGAQAEPEPEMDELEESLVNATLRELTDSADKLMMMEVPISSGTELVASFGGVRHPTTLLSERALTVIKRKASLLRDVEERTAAFEAAHARREELLAGLLKGSALGPPEMAGIRKFIASYTHCNGDPVDENKSDFAAFAATFKLPSRHAALRRLRRVANDAGEWWAEACLKQASDGHGHAVLAQIFDVALGTGVDREHYKLVRATRMLLERLAIRVLEEAKERQRKDEWTAERSATPKVGPASAAADAIEEDINNAIKEGVSAKSPQLKEAQAIVKALREADGQRKRLAARQRRLEGGK